MVLDGFIEGGANHFPFDRAIHVGHFFWPLPNEGDDEVQFGVVLGDAVGNLLQHGRLTRFRGGDDKPALATADGGNQVNEARGDNVGIGLEAHLLVGEDGSLVFKTRPCFGQIGVIPIHRFHPHKAVVLFALFGDANLADDHVPIAKPQAADLRIGDIHIIGVNTIVFARAQETNRLLFLMANF